MSTDPIPLADRYRGQRILITGASGLLGQAVLEKLLRALPEVEEVLLLMRPRGRASPEQRVHDILGSSLFRRLRAERPDFRAWWPTKITTVEGALGPARFGLSPDEWRELAGRVTAVIHIGAVASFDEPLDRVLEVNTSGALDVLELARQAGNAPLVHVSTCYVCGNANGTHREEPLPWGHSPLGAGSAQAVLDPEEALWSLLGQCRQLRLDVEAGLQDETVVKALPGTLSVDRLEILRWEYAEERLARLGARVANKHGWPDAYPMSKAWAEQLLTRRMGNVPLAIVRPAILASTVAEPEAGWLTGLRMADPIVAAMGRALLQSFPGDPGTLLDLVPCDRAANAILAALPERAPLPSPPIYQVAGSDRNPLPLGDFGRICHAALRAHPFFDRTGAPIEPSRIELVPTRRFMRRVSRDRRRLALKLAVLERLGFVGPARRLRGGLRFLRYAHQLGRAYSPYTERHFRFATDQLDELARSLTPADRARFPMDVEGLDWSAYLNEVHVPAVRREAGGGPDLDRSRATLPGPSPQTIAAVGS